jgi:hypothetical protein
MRRILALTLFLLLAAVPAAGAADWKDGGAITDPAQTAQPLDVAVDPQGEAAFVWSGYVQEEGGDARPLLRRRAFGQPLGNPRALFGGSGSVSVRAAAGEFLTTLQTPLSPPNQIFTQSHRNGTITADQIFVASPDERICAQATALAANGRAIVVYGVSSGGETPPPGTPCELFARVRPAPGQPFEAAVHLGQTERFGGGVSVALDADGRGFVTWRDPFANRLNAARYQPATGFDATPQILDVPGESPSGQPSPILRVAPTGRAVVVFASRTVSGGHNHVAVATGDTHIGFAPTEVVSGPAVLTANYGADLGAAIGADGTVGITWRAGRDAKARIQGLVAGPTELITADQTEALSAYGARGTRVTAGGGRVTMAWFRLVPGVGRAVEAAYGRPDDGLGSAKRISDGPVPPYPPLLTNSDRGATWIAWGFGLRDRSGDSSRVLQARKLTLSTNAYSRTLDVLRARTNIGEFVSPVSTLIVPTRDGAMLAAVARLRSQSRFFQLRTYGE